MVAEDKVYQALREVVDPELGVDIVSLGLIYGVSVDEEQVVVKMTLTSPGCPLMPLIDQLVKQAVGKVSAGVKTKVELVWDPPWIPEMISEEVRAELGFD